MSGVFMSMLHVQDCDERCFHKRAFIFPCISRILGWGRFVIVVYKVIVRGCLFGEVNVDGTMATAETLCCRCRKLACISLVRLSRPKTYKGRIWITKTYANILLELES